MPRGMIAKKTTPGVLKSQARKKRNRIARDAAEKAEAEKLGISVDQLRKIKLDEVLNAIEEQKREELRIKKEREDRNSRYSQSSPGFRWW